MKTRLFAFASKTLRNIEIAVKIQKWAVSLDNDASQLKLKAEAMPAGSRGILYCSEPGNKFLTVPFETTSWVDDVIDETSWPGRYRFPFGIKPLGGIERYLPNTEIKSFLRDSIPDNKLWNHIIKIGPRYAFVPSKIEESDWHKLVGLLAE